MSARPVFLGLAVLASLLAAVIAVEIENVGAPVRTETATVPIPEKPKAQTHAAASQAPNERTENWLTTSLARPLFSTDRRPTDVQSGTTPALPRLAGIVIGPFGESAIFAASDGGKPTVLTVGKTLGEYTVEKIEPGVVTVSGPEGLHQVVLASDAKIRHDLAPEPRRSPPAPAPVPMPNPALSQPHAQVPGQPAGGSLRSNVQVPNGPPPSRP